MMRMYLFLILTTFITAGFTAEPGASDPVPPEGMVYVPAGSFIMGSNYGDADEAPEHLAETEAFFIDKYEVSHAEYAKFDPGHTYPKGLENHAVQVTWEQAQAYAVWAGKRLPTEKEWEKAARGTDGRIFPWGDTYDATYVIWDQRYPRGSAIAKPESPYGCIGMAGGVWEWTADWYNAYPGNPIASDLYGEKYKVIRGGSNFNSYAHIRTTHRYYILPNTTGNYQIGFRCVKDAK